MKLVFSNGVELECLDSSTSTSIIFEYSKDTLDFLLNVLESNNLQRFKLIDITRNRENIIYNCDVRQIAINKNSNIITVYFSQLTEEQYNLRELNEQVKELYNMLTGLTINSESEDF